MSIKIFFITFMLFLFGSSSHSKELKKNPKTIAPIKLSSPKKSEWYQINKVGIEFGPSVNFLVADISTNAFGLGLGTQTSLSAAAPSEDHFGLKIRAELVRQRQEILTKSPADSIITSSSLKSLEQSWWLIGAGVERTFIGLGQTLFWESLLGYAIGRDGRAQLNQNSLDSRISDISLTPRSFFYLSGGIGARKNIFGIDLVASTRTFFILNSIYKNTYEQQAFIPIPFVFSLGAERSF